MMSSTYWDTRKTMKHYRRIWHTHFSLECFIRASSIDYGLVPTMLSSSSSSLPDSTQPNSLPLHELTNLRFCIITPSTKFSYFDHFRSPELRKILTRLFPAYFLTSRLYNLTRVNHLSLTTGLGSSLSILLLYGSIDTHYRCRVITVPKV